MRRRKLLEYEHEKPKGKNYSETTLILQRKENLGGLDGKAQKYLLYACRAQKRTND